MTVPLKQAGIDIESEYVHIVGESEANGKHLHILHIELAKSHHHFASTGKRRFFNLNLIKIPTAPSLAPEDRRAWEKAKICSRPPSPPHAQNRESQRNSGDQRLGKSHGNDDIVGSFLTAAINPCSVGEISPHAKQRIPNDTTPLKQVCDMQVQRKPAAPTNSTKSCIRHSRRTKRSDPSCTIQSYGA